MPPRANRPAHRLRSLLASCWLFSPVLVADAPSALATALSDTRLASWVNLLENSTRDDERAQLERVNHFINRSAKISPSPNTSAWCAWVCQVRSCA